MRLRSFFAPVVVALALVACNEDAAPQDHLTPPPSVPLSETRHVTYFDTGTRAESNKVIAEASVTLLNGWLHQHPNMQVRSFAPTLDNSGDINGFVLYHVEAENAKQSFDIVRREDEGALTPSVGGIGALQTWEDTNPAQRVVAFTNWLDRHGKVEGFIVCHERP